MRKLTLAAVTAAHLFAIVWIDQVTRTRKFAAREEPPPLVVFFLNARREEKQPEPEVDKPIERPPSPQPRRPAQPPELSKPSEPLPSPSTAITDWNDEAREAAEDYSRREQAKSQLRSFEHKFAEPAPPEKPGVFGLQKRNRRAGLVEPGMDNSERHWVTDNCYFEFKRGAPPPPPIAGNIRMNGNTLQCKPPPTGGGEHMFDDLKPDYLKRLPEPAR